jgi:hypothetical protein
VWYEVITVRDGQKYLVFFVGGGDDFYWAIEYRSLLDGEMVTFLRRGTPWGGQELRSYFYENGNSITEEEFEAAIANLDIIDTKVLNWWTLEGNMDMYEFVKTFADW